MAEDATEFFDAAAEGQSRSPGEANGLTEAERKELEEELKKTEEEINTLRQVLAARIKDSTELRRKLGISAWKELTHDVNLGLKTVKENPAYQKTGEILHSVGQKTTSALDTVGKKIGEIKTSSYFKSFEDRVGSAYSSVKNKLATSTSTTSGLNNFTADGANGSATIPEHKAAGK